MLNTSKSISVAEAKARTAINIIEADFAALPSPLNAVGKSAGELIVAAKSANLSNDPKPAVYALRSKLARELKAAKQPLIEAKKNAAMLLDLADAIRHQSDLPETAPPILAAQARTVMAGIKAGILDGNSIAAEIKSAAKDADERIDLAEKAFRRFASTGGVIAAKSAAAYYRQFPASGYQKAAEVLEKKADRLTGLHRLRFKNVRRSYRKAKRTFQ